MPEASVALQPTPLDDRSYDRERTRRKRAAALCQVGRYESRPEALKVVPQWPVVYWWSRDLLGLYLSHPVLGSSAEAMKGLITSDDSRFLRAPNELRSKDILRIPAEQIPDALVSGLVWAPYIKGAENYEWIEPLRHTVRWEMSGLEVKVRNAGAVGGRVNNEEYYFSPGVAFAMIGVRFSGRVHRYRSVFGNKGSSLFPDAIADTVCNLCSSQTRYILQSLNPGIGFEAGDVNRLPYAAISGAVPILSLLSASFATHESHREPSVEFKHPGPSPWRHAQDWAQAAVDRPDGAPLPPKIPSTTPNLPPIT